MNHPNRLEITSAAQTLGSLDLDPATRRRLEQFATANGTDLPGIIRLCIRQATISEYSPEPPSLCVPPSVSAQDFRDAHRAGRN